MGDNHEGEVADVAKKLGIIRAREARLWGRKVATAEVTPGMTAHHEGDGVRCICDACDGTRPQPTLPVALSSRHIVNQRKLQASVALVQERGTESEGTPYGVRKPVRANPPMRAPELNARQLAFLDRLRGR